MHRRFGRGVYGYDRSGQTAPNELTIFGTPFMGMVPLLVNYLPQQLAASITPAG